MQDAALIDDDHVPVEQLLQLAEPLPDHVPALQLLLHVDCKVEPTADDHSPALH